MTVFKCSKCGKEYQRKGYYDKHIKICTGGKPKSKQVKVKDSFVNIKLFDNVLKQIGNIEIRLSNLEKKFKNLNFRDYKNRKKPKKSMNLLLKSEVELINIIKEIINQTSNPYSIKGVISLEDLKKHFEKNYDLSQKLFEEMMLKLYRKAFIDLQAGGTPDSYHLKSPTGKEFFYLMIK